jgi:putative hydrolase of HD superfamily
MPHGKKESRIKARTEGTSRILLSAGAKLKETKRAGWMKKVGIRNPESVAGHSYRMALIGAYIAAERKDLDAAKLIRMCLLHDLSESFIGDLMPEEKTRDERKTHSGENSVMRMILSSLPMRIRDVFLSDWEELLLGKTRESKLAWDIDNLEMRLQAVDYVMKGYDKRKLSRFQRRKLSSRETKKILSDYSFLNKT